MAIHLIGLDKYLCKTKLTIELDSMSNQIPPDSMSLKLPVNRQNIYKGLWLFEIVLFQHVGGQTSNDPEGSPDL